MRVLTMPTKLRAGLLLAPLHGLVHVNGRVAACCVGWFREANYRVGQARTTGMVVAGHVVGPVTAVAGAVYAGCAFFGECWLGSHRRRRPRPSAVRVQPVAMPPSAAAPQRNDPARPQARTRPVWAFDRQPLTSPRIRATPAIRAAGFRAAMNPTTGRSAFPATAAPKRIRLPLRRCRNPAPRLTPFLVGSLRSNSVLSACFSGELSSYGESNQSMNFWQVGSPRCNKNVTRAG